MSDALINIRGDGSDTGFVAAVRDVLGQELPLVPNTTAQGEHCVYWLGPNEWLVQTEMQRRDEIVTELESALAKTHAAINDLSDGNVVIGLKGADVHSVLAQGCTLDFDNFKSGDCAQTGLGKASVLLRREAADEYTVIVRRSFAGYLRLWLKHATQGRGIEFG